MKTDRNRVKGNEMAKRISDLELAKRKLERAKALFRKEAASLFQAEEQNCVSSRVMIKYVNAGLRLSRAYRDLNRVLLANRYFKNK